MDYCKITTDRQALAMPNPFKLTIANPTEEQKSLIAQLDNWLEMVYTQQPSHDPEQGWLSEYWVQEGNKAIQNWEYHSYTEEE